MKTFIAASAAVVAILTSGAAMAQDIRIPYGDLDLASAEGAKTFDRRVDRALRTACRGGSRLQSAQCVSSLRGDIEALLPAARQAEYAQGRMGSDRVAVTRAAG